MPDDNSFRESVKISFQKAKKHNDLLENELKELKSSIQAQNEHISMLKAILANKNLSQEFQETRQNETISIGNEGVQASKQLSKQASKQLSTSFFNIKGIPEPFSRGFQSLTSREFMVFLMIYQLEEEKGFANFKDIAERLKLSRGCIRGYVYSLIHKDAPILSQKPNNRSVILTIQPHFRDLGLKQRLINIFYRKDPDQLTLG